jgi:hypothetical protein
MPNVQAKATQTIGSAVGRQPALNSIKDQQTIINLLHRILPEDGGTGTILPPPSPNGQASRELIAAIVKFQNKNVPLKFRDGRVDPHGFTLGKLNALARSIFPVDPFPFPIDPIDPPKPPPPPLPPPPPTPAVIRALGFTATNFTIAGNASVSFSVGPTGGALARFFIVQDGDPEQHLFDFAGVTLGKGPFPLGLNIAPSSFPSTGSRIMARRQMDNRNKLKGAASIIAASANFASPAGGSVALVLFGTNAGLQGNNLSLISLLRGTGAFGVVAGTFVGLDVGASVAAGALV